MGMMDNLLGGKRMPIFEGMDSVVGQSAKFRGELVSKGPVSINGEFEGKVLVEGEIIVSSSGKVIGEIHGANVVVSGRVDGNITAKETLEISRTGKVHGDIVGAKVVIEEGASYHGRVKVVSGATDENVESPPAPPQDSPPQF